MNPKRQKKFRELCSRPWQGMETLEDRMLLAASIDLTPVYVGTYAADGTTFLGQLDFTDPANRNPNYIHKFNILLTANDFAPGEDFENVVFDIDLGSHLIPGKSTSYVGVQDRFDSNGDGTLDTRVFTENGDRLAQDLQYIWVECGNYEASASRQLGETPRPASGGPDSLGYPTRIGSFFVKWDGTAALLSISPLPPNGYAWATAVDNQDGNGNQALHKGDTVHGGTFAFDTGTPRSLTIGDAGLIEGNSGTSNIVFTVHALPDGVLPITFTAATIANGTAVAGVDFTSTTQIVTIPAGQNSATFSVPILGNALDQDDRAFGVTLSDPAGATIADGDAVGTIQDDDPAPTLSVGDATISEGDSGDALASFTVSLSAAGGKTITVDFSTTNGTAVAGDDYGLTSGTLIFGPGELTKAVDVTVHGDTLFEPGETFNLLLANPANATLADGAGIGTIVNADPPAADPYEPDNTPDLATPILTDGTNQSHTVDAGTDVDWMSFHLDSASRVDLVTSGDSGDPRMSLYAQGDTNTALAFNDNFQGSPFAQIHTFLPSGDYRIKVDDGGQAPAWGAYNLSGTAATMNVIPFTVKTRIPTYFDADGTPVYVYFTGGGDGEVWVPDGGGDAAQIVANHTTTKSSLILATTGRGATTSVGSLRVNGDLNALTAKTTDLIGDLTVAGGAKKIQMADSRNAVTLSVGAPVVPGKDVLTLIFADVQAMAVTSQSPIKSLKAVDWGALAGTAQTISAPWIGTISIAGGSFAANLDLDGNAAGAALGSISVAQNATGLWDVTGSITKITVKGTFQGGTIASTGNMGTIAFGKITGSGVRAGMDAALVGRPTAAGQFGTATIRSLKVTGWKVLPGQTLGKMVVDLSFSAAGILSAKLINVDLTTGDGVGLYVLNAPPSLKIVTYVDTVSPANNYTWKPGGQPTSIIHLF